MRGGGSRSPRAPGTGQCPGLPPDRPPLPGHTYRVQCSHLQHHAAERLPVCADVQVHKWVPGGGRGRIAGSTAAAGAGRGEAQRRGAWAGEQAEQAGAAAQRQHRGSVGKRERGEQREPHSKGPPRLGSGFRRSRAVTFIGPPTLRLRPLHASSPFGPVCERPLPASTGSAVSSCGPRR